MSNLVQAYAIALAPEPAYSEPRDTEWEYLVTGFSECIDSFFAFGLFELAKRSSFFSPELVDTFEPIIQEECRHILLFANWIAWRRGTMPWYRRPWFELRVGAVWVFLAGERIGLARGVDSDTSGNAQDNNFTVNGSKVVSSAEVGTAELMRIHLPCRKRSAVCPSGCAGPRRCRTWCGLRCAACAHASHATPDVVVV